MALDKTPATAVAEAPQATLASLSGTLPLPVGQQAVTENAKAAAPKAAKKPDYTGEDKKVRGQVRMHAIIAGYRVGGMLAATLGTSPASVREELHKLAAEVADKIEGYSFDA